jgi:hypothetical protein
MFVHAEGLGGPLIPLATIPVPFVVGEGTLNDESNRSADDKLKRDSVTETTTVTVEEADAVAVEPRDDAALTPEEDKVIRMLYGKSLGGQEALEFAPGADMETRLKLAMIEAHLLNLFEAGALEPDPDTGKPRSVLADRLD